MCPERRVWRCEGRQHEPCCASDGGSALWVRRAGGDPKPPEAATVKSRCGERFGKRPARPGQVSDEKTNMSKPLLTHRKGSRRHRNPGLEVVPGTKAHLLDVPSARERPACGPGGARCIGGVSSLQALAWNRRTCRLDTDDQHKRGEGCPWSREGRTPSGRNREGQSTARHKDGTARSSDESPVMGLERRGRAGQIDQRPTPRGRN